MKLPFPLTIRFKSMLQSGVATRDLDVRWVSSLSWYFLNLFGLQSVFNFILGDDNGKCEKILFCFEAPALKLKWLHRGKSNGSADASNGWRCGR